MDLLKGNIVCEVVGSCVFEQHEINCLLGSILETPVRFQSTPSTRSSRYCLVIAQSGRIVQEPHGVSGQPTLQQIVTHNGLSGP